MAGSGLTASRARLALLFLALAAGTTVVLAPLAGARLLDLGALLAGEATTSTILWQIRLPRVLVAMCAGAILGTTGLTYQTLFRNPLAEPYTLGVAGGAALGAVIALRLGIGEQGLPLIAVASFAGALLASGLVLSLGRGGDLFGGSGGLLLAGVAVSFSCSALILFLQYVSDANQTFRIVRWMMGGLGTVGYREVVWLAPFALAALLALRRRRWELNLLLLGDELAASRGVELARIRRELVTIASIAVGAMVAVTGPVGFVGLMVPHVVRRAVGYDHLVLVPACALGGGIFLVLADLGARSLLAPAELPVGVLTSLLGGPFFLWLILSRRGRAHAIS